LNSDNDDNDDNSNLIVLRLSLDNTKREYINSKSPTLKVEGNVSVNFDKWCTCYPPVGLVDVVDCSEWLWLLPRSSPQAVRLPGLHICIPFSLSQVKHAHPSTTESTTVHNYSSFLTVRPVPNDKQSRRPAKQCNNRKWNRMRNVIAKIPEFSIYRRML